MTETGRCAKWSVQVDMSIREMCLLFLDELRDSEVMDMRGAGELLEEVFGLSEKEAQRILAEWIWKEKEHNK